MSTTKYIVNNVSGQTINGEQLQPYKVFAALLTQSGGDNPQSIYNVSLTIGVTYFINNNDGSGDFTNVGATTNEQGTYFVATGTTPNNWGTEYAVDLSFNTGAPVVTVLENTIGNIWFAYVEAGGYSVVSDDLFVDNKTFINVTHFPAIDDVRIRFTFRKTGSLGLINLVTVKASEVPDNDLLLNTPIEIRVYN